MPTMKEIAIRAGVSLGTVSHVLNNPAKVREPLRARVLQAVQDLGYQPSQLARGLRREKMNLIGMAIPDITNPFFPAVVRGAEDVAFSSGYRFLLCNTDNDHTKEILHLGELRSYSPSGLIVIPSNLSDLSAQAEPFRKMGAALVCADRVPKHWDGDTVTVDNEQGAYQATRYLIDLGHRQLATITGPLHLTNARDRLEGFRRALAEANIPCGPEYVQEATFDKRGGYAKASLLLRMLPRPTAIFASNDLMAFGALLAIREAGLRCPADISVMGFDNLDFAEMTNPALSTVSQPGYQLGTTAAQLLLDRVNGYTGPAKHMVLQTALIVRESAAPLGGAIRKRRASSLS